MGAVFTSALGAAADAHGSSVLGAHVRGSFLYPALRGATCAHDRPDVRGRRAAGSYSLSGRSVVSDGRVVRLEDGTLAGSAATMPDLIRLMARTAAVGPSRAISLASAVPARVLGERRLGRIIAGACADLVVLDADLRVRLTMVRGV